DTSSTSSSSSSLETFSASGTERRSTRGITEGGAGVGGGGNPPLGPGRGSAATEITGAAPLVLRDGTGGALGGLGTERPCWGGGGGTGAAALDFFLGPPGEIERAGAFEP